MLTQLRNAGKLERVVGIVIGEFAESDPTKEKDPWLRSKSFEDVLEEQLEPLGVPVLFNYPLGHGDHLATIPLGVTATIDADARRFTIDEPALEETHQPAVAEGRNLAPRAS
jgi:muramoyltetrapeptide carboxypeptidase